MTWWYWCIPIIFGLSKVQIWLKWLDSADTRIQHLVVPNSTFGLNGWMESIHSSNIWWCQSPNLAQMAWFNWYKRLTFGRAKGQIWLKLLDIYDTIVQHLVVLKYKFGLNDLMVLLHSDNIWSFQSLNLAQMASCIWYKRLAFRRGRVKLGSNCLIFLINTFNFLLCQSLISILYLI